ncbi:MAG: PdaC/SigV domain-containing protein [Sphingomicrobium sp.]
MTQTFKLVLPLLLVACPAAAQPVELPAETGPVTRQTADRESPLLDFEYSWPQAISSETRLVERLSADLSNTYDEALKEARANKQDMDRLGGPFNQNHFTRMWNLEGQTQRLISLAADTHTYTGGAHPNHTSSALLWDRSAQGEIKFAELFESPSALEGTVRARFCELLDAERLKRRQGETIEGFTECPAFSELTIAPADTNDKERFDSVQLTADPYVAGPYVEGGYEINVPVSAGLIGALKPEYRSDFEAQPRQ